MPPRRVFWEQGANPDVPPSILVDLPGLCVVHKPPGWEVDTEDVGSGIWLSAFLQQRFRPTEAPLVHYAEHQFGMLHRLDRVSSGLLLVGKTFCGFHWLNWQLNTGKLSREYVVLAHVLPDPRLLLVDAPVLHVHAEGQRESRVTEQGKPSQTELRVLGHLRPKSPSLASGGMGLFAIQIRTGRRHQIRAHLSFVGHPTAADGKYMLRRPWLRGPLASAMAPAAERDMRERPMPLDDARPKSAVAETPFGNTTSSGPLLRRTRERPERP